MSRSFLFLVAALTAGTAMAQSKAKDATEKSADARDKVICKKFLETGSLVKGTRICKTKADWDRDRAEARGSITQSNSCASGVGSNC